jgi:protein-S-isoprenylcysteine O-methyltransferase Ste14
VGSEGQNILHTQPGRTLQSTIGRFRFKPRLRQNLRSAPGHLNRLQKRGRLYHTYLEEHDMLRFLVLIYGIVCYVMFLGIFLYTIGFVRNFAVPKSIDSGTASDWVTSLVVDGVLLGLFAVQHSVMARPAFKRLWTPIVSEPAERSTYVLFTNLLLLLMFWQWRPLPDPVWDLASPPLRTLLWAINGFGWLVVLVSTFLIDHFELFGLRQVYLHFTGQPFRSADFQTRAFYRLVRHPLLTGFVIAFWVTPTMSVGHLFFAAMTTAYILVAVQLEERDLVISHGDEYREYQRRVGMLIPRLNRSKST